MSTKINVRSPYYLNLSAPTVPTPEFTCSTAFPRGLSDTGFAVDNQGIVTPPNPDFGTFESITSTDSDFSNGKFGTVSSDTARSVTARTRIPAGFSNSADIFKDCTLTTIQAGTSSSAVETPCVGGPTTSGSIPAVSLTSNGDSTTIDLASYFTSETTYAFNNPNTDLVSVALSGSNLTITSNTIAGSMTLYALGRDASYPTSCQATQSISVTVTLAVAATFDCNTSPLTGGGIAQDGTITRASTIGLIAGISLTDGGSLLTPESVSANNTSSAQNVQLFYRIVVPNGYSNSGATLSPDCSVFYSQAGTSDPAFTCDLANLTGQTIAKNGSIFKGEAERGTIDSFSPNSFPIVQTNQPRSVTLQVTIPSGFQNAGSTIGCPVPITQPADVSDCGTNEFYLTSVGKQTAGGFCNTSYGSPRLVKSTASGLANQRGAQICEGGTPFDGQSLFWGISTASGGLTVGLGANNFYAARINSSGIVIDLRLHTCATGSTGTGSELL